MKLASRVRCTETELGLSFRQVCRVACRSPKLDRFYRHCGFSFFLEGIETVEALGNVDAICATDGLTGLYVGPSDLAVSMGHNPGLDRTAPDVDEAIGKILATAKKHGRKVGIHCGTPEYLKAAYARGFDFATLASDVRMIGQAIGMNVNAVRG